MGTTELNTIGKGPAKDYLSKINRLIQHGVIGKGIEHVSVRHDDTCPFLRGGCCSCDAEIWKDGLRLA